MPVRALATRLLPLLDLTRLDEGETPASIEALCQGARTGPLAPAAVCLRPEFVRTARQALRGTHIRVATVVNFPAGGEDIGRIADDTRAAVAAGADEIDLVFPWRAFLRGERALAWRAVVAGRDACLGKTLKLILETGELRDAEAIRRASLLGIGAGVDFLKTSTGKAQVNATPQAAQVMLEAIADSGGTCGFKAAGGVRTLADAATYLELARQRLGEDWIDPTHFRIGASALFDVLCVALEAPA